VAIDPHLGEYEGSAPRAGHTRVRRIALLRAALVDALEIAPRSGDRCDGVALGSGRGVGHGRAAKELVDQRAAALGVVEEGGVAPGDDLDARVG
jgi:hypothetical protein